MHAKDWRVAVDAEMLGACGEEVLDLTKSLALGRFSTQGLLDGVPQHVLSAKEALRQILQQGERAVAAEATGQAWDLGAAMIAPRRQPQHGCVIPSHCYSCLPGAAGCQLRPFTQS